MCLVHDLAESLVGDITPFDGVSEVDKHQREEMAMARICALLGDNPAATEMTELWHEYEACQTPEARLVKDLDKFEMIVQAYEYEQISMSEARYRRLEIRVERLREQLDLDRIPVSQASLMLIEYTQQTPDAFLPSLWGTMADHPFAASTPGSNTCCRLLP
ncbi:hypothetical protein H4R34_000389 [Dimargaris verticillata]|uniref:G protein gamma domain-containing protein n=1 Tax=Dimargaris verticillata TaxID=2761393 RepID=A0A9W8BDC8_9FUNG|nr:hypothetical protein H4R34_000389 [Dimargaris verticillata]